MNNLAYQTAESEIAETYHDAKYRLLGKVRHSPPTNREKRAKNHLEKIARRAQNN